MLFNSFLFTSVFLPYSLTVFCQLVVCQCYNIYFITFSQPNNAKKPVRLSPEEQIQYMIKDKDKKGPKAQVDARFIAEFSALWKIMVPGLWSKESAFMVLIAMSLISRSMCDLWLIQHTTLVEG